MSMIVVYATATGHVLGALAPAGPTGEAPSVSSLVSDALPLWVGLPTGKAMSLTFPATALAGAVVTDQPDVLAVPMAFGVKVGSDKTVAPDLLPLTPSSGPNGPLGPPTDGIQVKINPTGNLAGVNVSLPSNSTADSDLAVLVLVANAGGTRPPLASTIRQGSSSTTIAMSLEDGPYAVLALVQQWRGVITVPAQ